MSLNKLRKDAREEHGKESVILEDIFASLSCPMEEQDHPTLTLVEVMKILQDD